MIKFQFYTIYIFCYAFHFLRFSDCIVPEKSHHTILIADVITFPDIQLPWIRIFDLGIMQERVWWEFVSLCLIFANYKKQTITSIGLFYKNVRECVDSLTCEELVGGYSQELMGGYSLYVKSFRETLSVPQELQVAEVEVQDVPLAEVRTVAGLSVPSSIVPVKVKNLLFP